MKYICHFCSSPTKMAAYISSLDETRYYPSCCLACATAEDDRWVPLPLTPEVVAMIAADPEGRKASEDGLHRFGRVAPWEKVS